MTPRWAVVDKMLRELGQLRQTVDTIEGTSAEASGAALDLRSALGGASEAVHKCLGAEDDSQVVAAWRAIAKAQDALRAAESAVVEAQAAKARMREMRSRAATQREAAKRWRRADRFGAE
jgi:chromosome segregation ATPase